MGNDGEVRITWPWLLAALAVGFASLRVVAAITGSAWISYVAFVVALTVVVLGFAWTRSRRR